MAASSDTAVVKLVGEVMPDDVTAVTALRPVGAFALYGRLLGASGAHSGKPFFFGGRGWQLHFFVSSSWASIAAWIRR